MIALEPPFRLARAADAAAVAHLVNEAGEGLPLALWAQMASPGEDPFAVGARRQRERIAEGRAVVVVDEGAGVLAALAGYPVGAAPEPVGGLPPAIEPLQRLENEATDTWYVNVLAAVPAARGHGHGTRLLALAERIAASEGRSRMSIIVADANAGARRLYERLGYREAARRPMHWDGPRTPGRHWILLVKDLH